MGASPRATYIPPHILNKKDDRVVRLPATQPMIPSSLHVRLTFRATSQLATRYLALTSFIIRVEHNCESKIFMTKRTVDKQVTAMWKRGKAPIVPVTVLTGFLGSGK